MMNRRVSRLTGLLLVTSALGCVSNDDYKITDISNQFEVAPLFLGIDEGIPFQMSATAGGDPISVTWSSSNAAVATVDPSGTVQTNCVPVGTATSCFAAITATQAGGMKKSASLTVYDLVGIALTSGVGYPGISGTTRGSGTLFRIYVPEGKASLTVSLFGGTGDLDLYVQRGSPEDINSCSNGLCSFNGTGDTETIVVPNPEAGSWYIWVETWDAGAGWTLKATVAP